MNTLSVSLSLTHTHKHRAAFFPLLHTIALVLPTDESRHAQTDRGSLFPLSAALQACWLGFVAVSRAVMQPGRQLQLVWELAAVPVWLVLFPSASGLDNYTCSEVAAGPEWLRRTA